MKTHQLAVGLKKLAKVSGLIDPTVAEDLSLFLADQPDQPSPALLNKLIKGLAAPQCGQDGLASLAEALTAFGGKAIAKDLALAGQIISFLEQVKPGERRERLRSAQSPIAKAKTKTRAANVLDARALADRLTRSAADDGEFSVTVQELELLSVSQMKEVAERFLGHAISGRSKKAIISAVQSRQRQDAIQASRERRISRIAV